MTNPDKIKLIEEFRNYHHAFLSPEGIKNFAEPFGAKVNIRMYKANPRDFKGLELHDDNGNQMDEAKGAAALTVAYAIADKLGLKENIDYGSYHGRGSQHDAICEAIIKKLS